MVILYYRAWGASCKRIPLPIHRKSKSILTCDGRPFITARMIVFSVSWRSTAALLLVLFWTGRTNAEIFRVATYNVENYLDQAVPGRAAKSAEARAKVRESLLALKPDVLALQEIGSPSALKELCESLKDGGLDLPYWEHITGFDTNIHVAVLSRFPFVARRPHTNESFLLDGRRYHVKRGFAELDIRVNTNFEFTLIAAHLKSKNPVPEAEQSELRLEEAKVLREEIDARFAADPDTKLVVLGDLNDTKDAPPTKTIIGRGRHKLVDTRPPERNGDWPAFGGRGARSVERETARRSAEPRSITWTHYYAKEDAYDRIDYILLSPGMARTWDPKETWVLSIANWGVGSDHRPIVAGFETEAR
jgi:endonuclease/exonuclease/phosphatase family metal-dependent hydrolase